MLALTKIDISFSLLVPTVLVRAVVVVTLLYRRLRYGYAFRRVKLTQGKYAIVDPEDFEELNQYKWFCTHYGYACRKIPKKLRKDPKQYSVLMHRELCPVPEGMVVDHINRKPHDNRRANLRPATKQQNCWNARFKSSPGGSKYTGVYFDKRKGKWRVHIGIDGKHRSFNTYADEAEAAKRYDELAKKYRGEFAVLNFPDENNK
jgi:hypothetical protein